jgi:hypothetical protein
VAEGGVCAPCAGAVRGCLAVTGVCTNAIRGGGAQSSCWVHTGTAEGGKGWNLRALAQVLLAATARGCMADRRAHFPDLLYEYDNCISQTAHHLLYKLAILLQPTCYVS